MCGDPKRLRTQHWNQQWKKEMTTRWLLSGTSSSFWGTSLSVGVHVWERELQHKLRNKKPLSRYLSNRLSPRWREWHHFLSLRARARVHSACSVLFIQKEEGKPAAALENKVNMNLVSPSDACPVQHQSPHIWIEAHVTTYSMSDVKTYTSWALEYPPATYSIVRLNWMF